MTQRAALGTLSNLTLATAAVALMLANGPAAADAQDAPWRTATRSRSAGGQTQGRSPRCGRVHVQPRCGRVCPPGRWRRGCWDRGRCHDHRYRNDWRRHRWHHRHDLTPGNFGGVATGTTFSAPPILASAPMVDPTALIEAIGRKNLYDAMALKEQFQAMQARELAEQERLRKEALHAEKFWEKRALRAAALKAAARPPVDSLRAAGFARARSPYRLSSEELDPATREIRWPTMLTESRFEAERKRIDELFRGRSPGEGGRGSEFSREVNQLTGRMLAAMRTRIREYSPQEYSDAKQFVKSLGFEAYFTTSHT